MFSHQNMPPRFLHREIDNVGLATSDTFFFGREEAPTVLVIHPPYTHLVSTTTPITRPLFISPNNTKVFFSSEDPVNTTTSLIRPKYFGRTVVVAHCRNLTPVTEVKEIKYSASRQDVKPYTIHSIKTKTKVTFINKFIHVNIQLNKHTPVFFHKTPTKKLINIFSV
jgi:hypothetical protein